MEVQGRRTFGFGVFGLTECQEPMRMYESNGIPYNVGWDAAAALDGGGCAGDDDDDDDGDDDDDDDDDEESEDDADGP